MGKALTVRTLESVRPGPVRKEVPDGLVRGLYFIVQPSGLRSWACRYRMGNRTRKLTIGSYPAVELPEARQLAKDALVNVARGIDPIEVKKASKVPADRDLVEKVVDAFVERHAKPNTRPSTAKETERSLKREVVERWKGRRLSSVSRADVLAMLDEIVDRGSPIAANRLLATFRKCCAWAVERGLVETSPCTGVTPPAANKSRDRVLSDAELKRIWQAAEVLGFPFGPLVKLLILTAQRRDEVAGLTWSELDPAGRAWTLPRDRAKNDTEHVVPLNLPALNIFEELPRIKSVSGFLFTTNGRTHVTGFSKAKVVLDKVIAATGAPLPHWTFHDLRRTAATGMARLGVNLPVIERVLNHVSGSFAGVAGIYNRHSFADEKRHALNAWGGFIERLIAAEPGENVVELRAAQ